jgi:hypothetical protein
MAADKLRNRGKASKAADAAADTASDAAVVSTKSNKKKSPVDPLARFNTPKAKWYRWICIKFQRVFMFVMLLVCLSKEDFATAFGAKTGVNRVHVSPIPVLACATHYTPYLEGRGKNAMMTLVRNAGVAGEFWHDVREGLELQFGDSVVKVRPWLSQVKLITLCLVGLLVILCIYLSIYLSIY